jgi:hypothetical protein
VRCRSSRSASADSADAVSKEVESEEGSSMRQFILAAQAKLNRERFRLAVVRAHDPRRRKIAGKNRAK